MKIVFSTIPMQKVDAVLYSSEENKAIEYENPVRFPINSLLAKTLKKGDEVKVVRIITEGEVSQSNVQLQKEELEKINESIGANIKYEEITAAFKETSDVVQARFRQIVQKLENECEVYADMTYGPKTLTPVLFYALGFAEKFFDADIKNIVYGKAVFNQNKEIASNIAGLFSGLSSIIVSKSQGQDIEDITTNAYVGQRIGQNATKYNSTNVVPVLDDKGNVVKDKYRVISAR